MQPNAIQNNPEPKIEQAQTVTPQAEQAAPHMKSEENQANWKVFREQRETERKAREASDKRAAEKSAEAEALKAALEALTNRPSSNRAVSDNVYDDIEETEDQRIDRRVEAAIKQRELQYEKERIQREKQEYPQRLNATFADFNLTISSENLDYLDYHYPEVSKPLQRLEDGYDKWADIYKAVKRFVPNLNSRKDEAKIEKNLNKPGSVSSGGKTEGNSAMPATRLDEARKKANWERMERIRQGLN